MKRLNLLLVSVGSLTILLELDLTSEIMVCERFIDNARIGSSTKWVYDKVENPNEVSKLYRRRIWVRTVIRETTTSKTSQQVNDRDEDNYGKQANVDDVTNTINVETRIEETYFIDRAINKDRNNGIYISGDNFDKDTSREEIEEVINPITEDCNSSQISIRRITRKSLTGVNVSSSYTTPTNPSSSTYSPSTKANCSSLLPSSTSFYINKIKGNGSCQDKME